LAYQTRCSPRRSSACSRSCSPTLSAASTPRRSSRNVCSGVGAVQRELSKLERSGLVSVERIGNQKHYRANQAAPIFEELRGLIEKTVGLAEPVKQSFRPYADTIKAAFVYGSVAKGTDTATAISIS
jgi:hypothetical protein